MILQIYWDFIDMSRTDKSVAKKTWVDFSYLWFQKKYGLRELAESSLIDFFTSMTMYEADGTSVTDRRFKAFLRWLGNDFAGTEIKFDLNSYIQLISAIKDLPGNPVCSLENGVVMFDASIAQNLCRRLLTETISSLKISENDPVDRGALLNDFKERLAKISRTPTADLKKVWGQATPKQVVDYDILLALFTSARRYLARDFADEYTKLFEVVDNDKSGGISFEELQKLFHDTDPTISETVILRMYQDGTR